MKQAPLIELENLSVSFPTLGGPLRAVDGVDLFLAPGESLGLVGESGCGKTVTALSILRLVPKPGKIDSGRISFRGRDLVALDESAMRRLRGREIGMVFQEPMRSLNPVFRCGPQVGEVLTTHLGMDRRTSRDRVLSLLSLVGLPDSSDLYDAYPHQLSGGMQQRVMIAMALACDPVLLVADEPTTALDVTIQAQIMSLLRRTKRTRDLAILFISHNLALVSETCERVAVMYAGRIVEVAPVEAIFTRSRHPYTRALIACLPGIEGPVKKPIPIPGEVPHPLALPPGCRFSDRCGDVGGQCRQLEPELRCLSEDHSVRCWLALGKEEGSPPR